MFFRPFFAGSRHISFNNAISGICFGGSGWCKYSASILY
jgi:hypothetical protein